MSNLCYSCKARLEGTYKKDIGALYNAAPIIEYECPRCRSRTNYRSRASVILLRSTFYTRKRGRLPWEYQDVVELGNKRSWGDDDALR